MASEAREVEVDGGEGPGAQARDDRLRRAVHVLLAVYLLPAIVLVLAVGGVLVALAAVGRLSARLVNALATIGHGRDRVRDRSTADEFLRVVNGPLAEKVQPRVPARQGGGPWGRPGTHGVN